MTTPSSTDLVGPITITRTGKGFFPFDPEQDDLFIPGDSLGGALPGDTVRIERTGPYTDPRMRTTREGGKVVEVVARNRTMFVGTLIPDEHPEAPHGQVLLRPDWKKMYVPIRVDGESLPIGQKVVVKLGGWNENQPIPWGTLSEIIGPAGVHETEMRALALGSGFDYQFPPGVISEAKSLEEHGRQLLADGAKAGHRKDFRGTVTFTIDPFDAKDFDDAISVKKLDNGLTEVGVHIADVSYFVRTGSSIDDEARKRATSVYLVDRTIPMLPEVLSTDLCSLNPNENRLAVSAVFTLDSEANVVQKWFGETVIHSDRRFTYEDAQAVLDTGEGDYKDELFAVRDLARLIRTRRVAKGAIEFDTPEVKVELDETGKPIAIHLKERKDTNLLIEDFMLLANESVAEYLEIEAKKVGKEEHPVFRVHDAPDADRIENLTQFLRVLGYDLDSQNGKVTGIALNEMLAKLKGKPEEYLIKTATLRSMAKATYTTKNIGHFGLAFEFYTHFTSPIRRYPDLLTHRMLKHHTNSEPLPSREMAEFEELAKHSSEREVAAAEAERDSVKMKLVEFMSDKVGQEFDGVISGVTDRGLYIEIKDTRAEGMLRISEIGNDFFDYDEKRYRLVGRSSKKEYALGDPIRVKLIAARIMDKELDFSLAPSSTS